MVKVAFCDDDFSVLGSVSSMLDDYREERQLDLGYTAYESSLNLLSEVERGSQFTILFMDVLMPGMNGIEAAEEIRKYDENVKIIFLTSSAEFAVQSYTVGAFFYQLKPIWKESFYRLMDSVLAECDKERTNSLILRCKTGITRILLNRLEYCEVIGRTLFIHLSTGEVLESSGSMDNLCQKLAPYKNFLRVHRSYLINMDYVQSISNRSVTMKCLADIPVPHGKYREIKDTFFEYVFEEVV